MKFKNARVGNKVWSIILGPGTITDVREDEEYQLKVDFEKESGRTYNLQGFYHCSDHNPELFWNEQVFGPDPEPRRLPDLDVSQTSTSTPRST